MADSEPTVRVSGIVLASLMFQHVNSDSDAEGLILGESRFEEQITISDSQADQIHIEEIYNIQKHIGCRGVSAFYNGVGDVAADAIDRILADNKQERLIGWYRQRRNSDQQMTFREKVVHERLKASLSNPHMIFLLLTPSIATATGSTHRMEYAAFLSRSRQFLNVPVSVTNLGVLEQLAYWRASAPCSALGYDLAMKKHSSIFFSSDGLLRDVSAVNAMNECLQAELQAASRKLEDSERLLETLQEEVSALRREITEKTRSGAGRDEGPADDRKQRLHAAFRALLACSPLAHTHTLTLDALPVPDACCRAKQGEQDAVSTATPTHCPDTASVQETLLGRNGCRKRAREAMPGGQEKQEELELRIRRPRRTFPVETP